MLKQVAPDSLLEDLQAVVQDAESLLKATAGQAGEKIQEVRARTEESLRRAKSRLSAIDREAMQRTRALASEADDYVRTNPWQAIGTAAGIALLVGLLLRRH